MLRRFFISAISCVALAVVTPAGAATRVDSGAAVTYLASQQSGGTDHANGAGSWDGSVEFQTSEVILAIAEVAQTGSTWDAAVARNAVLSVTNDDGINALAFLDDMVEAGVIPGIAAKLLLIVAAPLDDGTPGFDPEAWDPAGDGNPVNLVAAIDGGCSDDPPDYGFLGQTLVAMQAKALLCGTAGAAAMQTVRDAQQDNGGWSYDGDPSGVTDADTDTTSAAIMALVAGGADGSDAAVIDALKFLADRQDPAGWWPGYDGEASPDSTSRATLAIAAAGYDPALGEWRGLYQGPCDAPGSSGYISPDDALAVFQQSDGSIAGPTTFSAVYATAQAVQGLERNWLPVRQAVLPPPPVAPDVCGTTLPAPTVTIGPAGPDDPQLPRTGSDVALGLVTGVLCVTLGAALVVRRRPLV